jgi:hypothetical protein
LLIDADNTSWKVLDLVMTEVASFGSASARRIYGDWTQQQLSGWKLPVQKHAITPIQQFTNTTGKNNTDSAMIIDAMDLLHSRRYEAFCLITSDADFTRLATRIREDGLTVVGIGRERTPRAFIAACNQFTAIEALQAIDAKNQPTANCTDAKKGNITNNPDDVEEGSTRAAATPTPLSNTAQAQLKLLHSALADLTSENPSEWIHLSLVGDRLARLDPGFDPRNFGHKTLRQLVESTAEGTRYKIKINNTTLLIRQR